MTADREQGIISQQLQDKAEAAAAQGSNEPLTGTPKSKPGQETVTVPAEVTVPGEVVVAPDAKPTVEPVRPK